MSRPRTLPDTPKVQAIRAYRNARYAKQRAEQLDGLSMHHALQLCRVLALEPTADQLAVVQEYIKQHFKIR